MINIKLTDEEKKRAKEIADEMWTADFSSSGWGKGITVVGDNSMATIPVEDNKVIILGRNFRGEANLVEVDGIKVNFGKSPFKVTVCSADDCKCGMNDE